MDAARERRNENEAEANKRPAPHPSAHPPPTDLIRNAPPAVRLSGGAAAARPQANGASPSAEEVAKNPGAGETLQPQVRATLERTLGQDLRGVRVHQDGRANAAADNLGAHAFTYGPHIFLGSRSRPTDTHLLAHESAHVVQQQGAPAVQRASASPTSDGLEHEADRAAAAAQIGGRASVRGRTGGARVQGSFWDKVKGAASAVGGAIAGGARAVGGAVVSGAKAVGSAVGSAWSTATRYLGSAASWVWHGLQSLGHDVLNWLSMAGRAVWEAIKWFGGVAWDGIKWLGSFLWEKLSLLGSLVWSWISNLPFRFWRYVVHLWDGITGVLGWLWTGLKGAAGWVWDAVVGVFSWLGRGLRGALAWLGDGLSRAAAWAVSFISSPSLSALWHGLLGVVSWLGRGVKGLLSWGWNGIVAAAVWAWRGLKGLGLWLWDGVLRGLVWMGTLLLYLAEFWGVGELLQFLYGLIFRLRRLTAAEVAASLVVHAGGQVPYWQVRVDDNSILIRIGTTLASWFKTKVSPGAITTMHIIHLPAGGVGLEVMVHELTHVAQYQRVGAIYMPQALHAQNTAGYNYGNLAAAAAAGKHFSNFNREQQASMCEDYYLARSGGATAYGGTVATLQPFIDEMRGGGF